MLQPCTKGTSFAPCLDRKNLGTPECYKAILTGFDNPFWFNVKFQMLATLGRHQDATPVDPIENPTNMCRNSRSLNGPDEISRAGMNLCLAVGQAGSCNR